MKFDKCVLSCFQPLFSVQSLVSELYIKSSDNDVTCYTEAPVLFLPLCDPYEVFCSLSSDFQSTYFSSRMVSAPFPFLLDTSIT